MKTNLPFYYFLGLVFILITSLTHIQAQETTEFESFGVEVGAFNNDAMSAGFNDGNIFFPSNYNEEFFSWDGWAISATTDVETHGWGNQYSAITGEGADGSTSYGVSFPSYLTGVNYILPQGGEVTEMAITNGTYSYFSILEGDAVAKRFGGETGDDPDFFLLTINGYLNGEANEGSVEFYLADYRFDDNSMDYIVTEWTTIDLTVIGLADSITFALSSSDNGEFGMNTPAYFCADNIATVDMVATTDVLVEQLSVFPNPATDKLQLVWPYTGQADGILYNAQGQLVAKWTILEGVNTLAVEHLPSGLYSLVCEGAETLTANRIIKK